MITEFKIFENMNLKKYLLLHSNMDKDLYFVLKYSNFVHNSNGGYISTKKQYELLLH